MNYISLLVNAICLLTWQVNRKKVGIYAFIDRQVCPPPHIMVLHASDIRLFVKG